MLSTAPKDEAKIAESDRADFETDLSEWIEARRPDMSSLIVSHPYIIALAKTVARRRCSNPTLAEEVWVDALGDLWEELDGLPDPTLGWDHERNGKLWSTVVFRRVMDGVNNFSRFDRRLGGKRNRQQLCDPADEAVPDTDEVDRQDELDFWLPRLYRAWKGLPERYRDALEAVVMAGASYNSAKSELAVACHHTVKNRVEKGLALLRQSLNYADALLPHAPYGPARRPRGRRHTSSSTS